MLNLIRFGPGSTVPLSHPHERGIGLEGLQALVVDDVVHSWQWQRYDASARGSVGWLLAEGAETVLGDGVEQRFPHRMTLVCERRGGRWLIAQIHGSSPHHD